MDINVTYPARYQDQEGTEKTTIRNDGRRLYMTVRGVKFEGTDFDDLRPVEMPEDSAGFTFAEYLNSDVRSLCCCAIDWQMEVPVCTGQLVAPCDLRVRLVLGGQDQRTGGIDQEDLSMTLSSPFGDLKSKGTSGWFEDELLDIQRQLPDGVFLKACINCAFSDYSPFGHDFFGSLACFRDNKEGYLKVESKRDLFDVWDTMTEFVQETYLCPDFKRRKAGAGYRG